MIHLTWTLSLQSIESVLGTATYQNNKVNQWTSSIVEQCLNQLTKLGKPFKYIGTWMSLSSSGWHHWIILCRFSHNPFSVFSSSLCPLPYHLLSSLPRILRPFSRPYLSTLSFYLTGLLPPSLSMSTSRPPDTIHMMKEPCLFHLCVCVCVCVRVYVCVAKLPIT